MLSEEEKKAIKILGTFEFRQKTKNYNKIDLEDVGATNTVLNLIAKLKKENKEKDKYIKNSENITTEMSNDINKLLLEIKEKDKQIDLMARAFKQDDVRSVEEIKQFYERKVEDEEK